MATKLLLDTYGCIFLDVSCLGPLGMGVHLENTVDINHAHWNNRELAMRVETDVRDDHHTFCTDVNGFQVRLLTLII